MSADRDILIAALETALPAWEQWKLGRALLAQFPPDSRILNPITAAIERCEIYCAISGHVLFTANSGSVLRAPMLASPLLYRAERAKFEGGDISLAADWLIRVLSTKETNGVFKAVLWGISVDEEVTLSDGSHLVPFEQLPDSTLKSQIVERASKLWDGAVWLSKATPKNDRFTAALWERWYNSIPGGIRHL
jgi:hypothetical protein